MDWAGEGKNRREARRADIGNLSSAFTTSGFDAEGRTCIGAIEAGSVGKREGEGREIEGVIEIFKGGRKRLHKVRHKIQ